MSVSALSNSLVQSREAALSLAWGQWSVMGGQTAGNIGQRPRAIVDPESLILFSSALRDVEPRLWDMASGFMVEGAGMVSVQRMRNLLPDYPHSVAAVFAELALIAARDGKDARWKPFAAKEARPFRKGKVHRPAGHLGEPSALLLRFRLGFGVHARTDALAFLVSTSPSAATVTEVSEATRYGPMPIRRALEAMAAARLIVAHDTRPEKYHAPALPWTSLLGGEASIPAWRYWHPLFAFLAAIFPSGPGKVREASPYAMSSEFRTAVLAHRRAFTSNRIAIPEPADYPGEAFLDGMRDLLAAVVAWLGENR